MEVIHTTKNEQKIDEKILEIVKTSAPETVEKLVEQAQKELGISKDAALKLVIDLHNEGKLSLVAPPKPVPTGLIAYTISSNAAWFWVVIALAISNIVAVFTIAENMYPYVYIRYLLGSVFVLFLPGYVLIRTLFPTKEIDNIERTALSIGISLALVPLVGLLLNYTPWGIKLTPIALSLLYLTLFLSIIGLIRDYQTGHTN